MLGRTYVTLSSLQTIIVEIEAHLNHRPLTYVSSDLNEPEPLTPSQFLYGRLIDTVPHSANTEDKIIDDDLALNYTAPSVRRRRPKHQ